MFLVITQFKGTFLTDKYQSVSERAREAESFSDARTSFSAVKGMPRAARLSDIGKVFAENPQRGIRARFRYSVILNLSLSVADFRGDLRH